MRIVVLDGHTLNPGDNPWDALAALGSLQVYDRSNPDCIIERARDAEVVLTNKTRLPAEVVESLSQLRFIAVLATGYDVVDVAAARDRDIPVSNVPEYGTDSVAQHVFALLLELCHRVGDHNQAVGRGEWSAAPDFCFWRQSPVELAGLTLGIVGLGRIGGRVAELANCFGMTAVRSRRRNGGDRFIGSIEALPLETLFARADVVSLHCPLTAENTAFVNDRLLRHMKPSAFLINTARGALIDEADLAAALNDDRLAGAGLDVVSKEPMCSDNPLATARNCIITPHLAWASLAARRRLMAATVDNVKAFQCGRPINVVNGL